MKMIKLKKWFYNTFIRRYVLYMLDENQRILFEKCFLTKKDEKTICDIRHSKIIDILDEDQRIFFEKCLLAKKDKKTICDARHSKIIDILNSEEYKKYFFKSVGYEIINQPKKSVVLIKRRINNNWDIFCRFIAKNYLFLFHKKLYKEIQKQYREKRKIKQFADNFLSKNNIIDDYMKKTTISERIDRAINLGIIDSKTGEAQNNYIDRIINT